MLKHALKIEQNSEAEEYFLNEIMSNCEDEVICRLGIIFGWPYNEYEISDNDFNRCHEYVMKKTPSL